MSTVSVLQTALAAEHAAVYVYGVLGGRTSQAASPTLYTAVTSAYAAHRARRDRLMSAIRDLDAEPVAAEPAYEVPGRPDDPDRITAAALDVERSTASTYAYVVAGTVGPRRRWAIEALNEAAVRELAFRGTPETFPGADEYADR